MHMPPQTSGFAANPWQDRSGVFLGIDLGSTSLRAALWDPKKPDKECPVLSNYFNSNARYKEGDFDTTCRIGNYNIWYDDDETSNHDQCDLVRAKALMYVLCGDTTDRRRIFEQCPSLADMEDSRGRTAFHKAIIVTLTQMFIKLSEQIAIACDDEKYKVSAIALSIPTQWSDKFEDVYRGIVSDAFGFPSESIFIYTETLCLSRYLVRNRSNLLGLEENTMLLILDFGGHSLNHCMLFVKKGMTQDEHPAYFRLGEAKGMAGGSENWEHALWMYLVANMFNPSGRAVPPASKKYICDRLNEKKKSYYNGNGSGGMTITYQNIRITAGVVDKTYNEAIGPLVTEAVARIQEFARTVSYASKRVIVSGGTSKIGRLKSSLRELVDQRSSTTSGKAVPGMYPRPMEFRSEAGKDTIPCLKHDELRFVEERPLPNSSSKIALGAALIAGSEMTVNRALDLGAVFGFQKKKRDGRWSDSAQIALRKPTSPARNEKEFTFRGEEVEAVRIVCNPFFATDLVPRKKKRGATYKTAQIRRTFDVYACYDVREYSDIPDGEWRWSLEWVDDSCTKVRFKREKKEIGGSKYEIVKDDVEPVFFDKSENCTHFGEVWEGQNDQDIEC